MNAGFPTIATVDEIYRPLKLFLEGEGVGSDHLGPLGALDVYLLHLLLEFCTAPVTVVDLACASTRAATAFVSLENRNVTRIVAAPAAQAPPGEHATALRLLESLRSRGGSDARPALTIDQSGELSETFMSGLKPRPGTVLFLVDAAQASERLPSLLKAIHASCPAALTLVLGVGRAGQCPAAEQLGDACRGQSPLRYGLLRDLSGALAESRLALVSPRAEGVAAALMLRLEELFATNFDFLQLAHGCSMYAIEQGLAARKETEIQQLRTQVTGLREQVVALESSHGEERERLHAELDRFRREAAEFDHFRQRAVELESTRHEELEKRHQAFEQIRTQFLELHAWHEARTHELTCHLAVLQDRLDRECTRPVIKTLAVQSGRRLAGLVRRNRSLLAPSGSLRERFARELMHTQRRLRGKAG